MKVMHVIADFGVGGAEMGIVRLVNNFVDDSIEHEICSLGSNVDLFFSLNEKVPFFSLGVDGKSYTVFFKLAKLFKKRKIDIVHVNNLSPWFDCAVAAKLSGAKCIQTFHGIEQNTDRFTLQRRLLLQVSAFLSSAIMVVGSSVAVRLEELAGINRKNVKVVYNGVDTKIFRPAESFEKKASMRKSLGVSPCSVLFGCVAGLRPVKNHDGLLRAFSNAIKKQGKNKSCNKIQPELLIVGNGELSESLIQLSLELEISDKIHFLGNRSDVPEILQCLDCFVLNSMTEGMSFAVLEAMATALPVIATDVGEHSKLIKNEITGYIVEKNNIDSLTNAIIRMSSLVVEGNNVGTRSRERAIESFSFKKQIHELESIYHHL